MPRKKSLPERRILWQKYLMGLLARLKDAPETHYSAEYEETSPWSAAGLMAATHTVNSDVFRDFEVGTLMLVSASGNLINSTENLSRWRVSLRFRQRPTFWGFFVPRTFEDLRSWDLKRRLRKFGIYRSAPFSDLLPSHVTLKKLPGAAKP